MKTLFLILILTATSTASAQWCYEITLNFTDSASGTTVYFTDQSSASNGWGIEKRYWDYGDSTVDSMVLNPVHLYAQPGFYNVCVTIHGVLPGDSATELRCVATKCNPVHALGTGISDMANTKWQVYPNPFSDKIQIPTTETLASVKLSDVSGRKIYEGVNENLFSISTDKLPAGVYFLDIRTTQGVFQQKLIKSN